MNRKLHPKAFVLLETMLAVMVFCIGIMALGKCVQNCLFADRLRNEYDRARLLLSNRMAEILAGVNPPGDKTPDDKFDDDSAFHGMILKTSRVELKRKNEKNEDLTGLYAITLEAQWVSDGLPQSKQLTFYVYPRPR